MGLVGPNGSGKSTVVRALSRVLPPTRGQVLLDSVDIYRMAARELARRLAVVSQDNSVGFDFLVREVVMMGRAPISRALGSSTLATMPSPRSAWS